MQSTSVPGVAQRTGATIYYLEFFPRAAAERAGREPVMALMPVPGDVDCVDRLGARRGGPRHPARAGDARAHHADRLDPSRLCHRREERDGAAASPTAEALAELVRAQAQARRPVRHGSDRRASRQRHQLGAARGARAARRAALSAKQSFADAIRGAAWPSKPTWRPSRMPTSMAQRGRAPLPPRPPARAAAAGIAAQRAHAAAAGAAGACSAAPPARAGASRSRACGARWTTRIRTTRRSTSSGSSASRRSRHPTGGSARSWRPPRAGWRCG